MLFSLSGFISITSFRTGVGEGGWTGVGRNDGLSGPGSGGDGGVGGNRFGIGGVCGKLSLAMGGLMRIIIGRDWLK